MAEDLWVLDVRDLVDRRGNSAVDVRRKIDEAVGELARGKRVVVCCDYGISRSNAVAAGVLAVSEAMGLDDAVSMVVERTGEISIKLEVLAAVRKSIDKETSKAVGAGSILLTGGTGFIGRRLTAQLGLGAKVIAPTHRDIDLARGSVPLDLLVRQRQVRTIVHLSHPRIVTANASIGEAVTAMKNVIDVCASNKLRLVFLSGWEVFTGYRTSLNADETLAPLPSSTYGFSKAFCETLAQQVAAQQDFPLCLIRSGPVFGADSDRPRFIRTFVDLALRNEPIAVHRYRNDVPRLDLMHVDDLVEGIAAVVRGAVDGVFHFGSGQMTSTTEVAERVIRVLQSGSPIVTREIDVDVCNVAMNTSRARDRLGWSPRIDPGPALDQLIAEISQQGWVSPVRPVHRTDQ
jgi:UDP-glucuronate decarboxylase